MVNRHTVRDTDSICTISEAMLQLDELKWIRPILQLVYTWSVQFTDERERHYLSEDLLNELNVNVMCS